MAAAGLLAPILLLALLAGCAAQPGAADRAPDVKCQLGNREPYVAAHHCLAMGGIPLRRAGTTD